LEDPLVFETELPLSEKRDGQKMHEKRDQQGEAIATHTHPSEA
jgi:hypothetical protein